MFICKNDLIFPFEKNTIGLYCQRLNIYIGFIKGDMNPLFFNSLRVYYAELVLCDSQRFNRLCMKNPGFALGNTVPMKSGHKWCSA